ncbi:hypothetical protein H6F67_03405 [Microcoleus sp. FACHB-1515]|uniref:hypothetical protein n=1 Tax=Cyanophyceae TaxID=3028117 RepID=UPI001681E3BF|nr:hypothetical protein [Microcoleus sp. FACHB-1515]MBD2088897.1 hypothetical protein [Microcoleus sp. FACHB-1515]
MKTQFLIAIGAIAALLNACVPYPDSGGGGSYRMPIPVPAGGGGSVPRTVPPPIGASDLPSQPLYAQDDQDPDYWQEDGVRELHGATSPAQCQRMAERFRQEGRNIRLVAAKPNRNPGSTLPYYCVFEGPDASSSYFQDNRYNSPDEYQ